MDVQDMVFQKVAEQMSVGKETLTRETTFSQLGADSLDMVEFSLDLEDTFSISIPASDIENIKSLGQAIDFIEKNKK